jgi:uncharacterized protein YukE
VDPNPVIAVRAPLAGAGAELAARAATIADELHALAAYLDCLPATWQGTSAGLYTNLQQEWNVAATGLFGPDGVLEQVSHALGVACGNYAEAEWANRTTIAGQP